MGLRSIWRNWKKSRQLKRQIENATGENYFQLINWWETEEIQHHKFRLFIEHYHLNPQKKPIVFFRFLGKGSSPNLGKGKSKYFFQERACSRIVSHGASRIGIIVLMKCR